MINGKESRNRHPVRLPTALLSLALFAGSASVGHTGEPSSLVITAERPEYTDFSASIRDELHDSTEVAVWMTRISVGTDLGMKLSHPGRTYRMAAIDQNKRG